MAESEHSEHQYVDDGPIGDVRVYPHLFKTRRVDDGGHDEYIATEVRIRLGSGPRRKNRKGEYVMHPDLATISVENQDRETLAQITMHYKDEVAMMETLVYWYAGMGGLTVLQEQMKKEPIHPWQEDEED